MITVFAPNILLTFLSEISGSAWSIRRYSYSGVRKTNVSEIIIARLGIFWVSTIMPIWWLLPKKLERLPSVLFSTLQCTTSILILHNWRAAAHVLRLQWWLSFAQQLTYCKHLYLTDHSSRPAFIWFRIKSSMFTNKYHWWTLFIPLRPTMLLFDIIAGTTFLLEFLKWEPVFFNQFAKASTKPYQLSTEKYSHIFMVTSDRVMQELMVLRNWTLL